jgi:hypothetical protein
VHERVLSDQVRQRMPRVGAALIERGSDRARL